MKLSDFSLLSSDLVQMICSDIVDEWEIGDPVQVQQNGDGYLIRQGDLISQATVAGGHDRIALQVQRGMTLWVLRSVRGESLHLQWLDLVEQIQLDMSISVDEAVSESLSDKGEIQAPDVASAVTWLGDRFIARDGGSKSLSGLNQVFMGRFDNNTEDSFVLFGAGWRGIVKRDKGGLKLVSLSRLRVDSGRLASAVGRITFQDASVAAQLQSADQRALLDAALRDNGSYLRLWQEYGALEWEQARDCARDLGSLRFMGARLVEGERWAWFLKVDPEQLKEFLGRWRVLGLSSTTQVELGDRELDLGSETEKDQVVRDGVQSRPVRGVLEFEREGVVLVPSQDRRSERPPSKGYIYYSLSGDETVQNRRARARKSINDGRRLPQLSYLLEGMAPPVARRRQLVGLSTYARASFKGTPTDRQKLALDVAINTPDIALIVGPPGTGKTQVIAALQRRLAETLGEHSLQHQVLISSYQHDAVDNALNRTEVFGLPAERVGGRARRDEGGVDPVGTWCQRKRSELASRLDAVKENEPLTQPLLELGQRITTLRLARLSPAERHFQFEKVAALLQQLAVLDVRLPPMVRDRWEEFFGRQSQAKTQHGVDESAGLLRMVRALRTTRVGLSDDGADRAHQLDRALRRSGVKLRESEGELLQRIANSTNFSDEELADLTALKQSVLDHLMPDYRPPLLKQSLNAEALELLADIEHAIAEPLRQSRRGISSVMASYHAALAQSPERAAQAVREYASIVGATCQQAAGKSMSSLKELSDLEASEGIEFDTVVIDEAARANPLDLFVPMAMARRRIILVGDHRQLPHLVQRELEDELIARQSLTEAQAKAYEQSLFERLVKQLREQEKVDNIRRVVMLDTQYRMHPILGDFISKQFYEVDGLGVLRSGRPPSDFAHEIPGYQGKCAAWLDVPMVDGKEGRKGSSRVRQAEASAIAREVKRIADSCGPSLSIGIISFYRAQCELILDSFVEQGLADQDDGDVRIARQYRQTDLGEERLRVGTVDAFQGKEFDVVFLSVVRANDKVVSDQIDGVERDRLLTGKYGHLRLANRLNVAMSRQRKLLVAVGDRGMAEGTEAEEAVPALAEFLKLCRKEASNVR